MAVSNDLINQFAKVATDGLDSNKETTVYGTAVENDGSMHVRIDGSSVLTPAVLTSDVHDGERVTVMIKNHTAIITGNMTSPSARTDDVKDLGIKMAEFDIVVTDSLDAHTGRIGELEADNVTINGRLVANEASIGTLEANNVTINETLVANKASIETLEAHNVTINETLVANKASIETLEADNVTVNGRLVAAEAFIESADMKYVNIDRTNIDQAWFGKFYSDSGIIGNMVIQDGTITGDLVGVRIKGDLIEANTLRADRLIVQGKDGLYYRLNVNALGADVNVTEAPTDSLHGSILTAQSITADKVFVSDLTAFGATIGGFKITDNAIYSGVKDSAVNTAAGVYMDSDGQIAFGDTANRIEYHKTADDSFILSIRIGDKDVQTAIQALEDSIVTIVTDENGGSRMVQKGGGWEFNIGDIQDSIDEHENQINDLDTNVGNLKKQIAYVRIDETDENNPILTLGSTKSDFAVTITNKQISFMDGGDTPAYINNSKLMIENAEVKSELQFGQFVWSKRENGNMGVTWVDSEEVSG